MLHSILFLLGKKDEDRRERREEEKNRIPSIYGMFFTEP